MEAAARQHRGQDHEVSLIYKWLSTAKRTGIRDSYAGKRRTPRYQIQLPVVIEVNPGTTKCRMLYVNSRDISRGGIGVTCREKLQPLTPVRIYVDDGEASVSGIVRHASPILGAYIVGIEFNEQPTPSGRSLRLA